MHSHFRLTLTVLGMLSFSICAYFGLGGATLADRDLTDAEMAGIKGRDPTPGNGCDGCERQYSYTPCTGSNPCLGCRVVYDKDNPETCQDKYANWAMYTNNNDGWTASPDPSNDKVIKKDTVSCRSFFECASGEVRLNTACTAGGGTFGACSGYSDTHCRSCSKGGSVDSFKKQWDDCLECPYN